MNSKDQRVVSAVLRRRSTCELSVLSGPSYGMIFVQCVGREIEKKYEREATAINLSAESTTYEKVSLRRSLMGGGKGRQAVAA